jgi:hypothetical protein
MRTTAPKLKKKKPAKRPPAPSTPEVVTSMGADAGELDHAVVDGDEDLPVVDPTRTAAATMLKADHRNRKVVLEELLANFGLGDSDAARCVRLAAAKMAYETIYPETKHGAAPKGVKGKDPKSGSFPFWKYAMRKVGGWKRSSISRWCSIGEGVAQGSYDQLLGTPLANDMGRLEKLSKLHEADQLNVAIKYNLRLEREGKELLQRLTSLREQASREGESPDNPKVQIDGPPSDPKEIEILKVADGAVCILNDHVLRVTDLGERIRVTFLGAASKKGRPEVVATEDWTNAVTNAVTRFRHDRPKARVEVSPITWVPPTNKVKQHHLTTITVTGPFKPPFIINVERWDTMNDAGQGSEPAYLSGLGDWLHIVWCMPKDPVITLSRGTGPAAAHRWLEGNFNHAARIECVIYERLKNESRPGRSDLRQGARSWFQRERTP